MAMAGTRTLRLAPCDDPAQGAQRLASALDDWGPERGHALTERAFLRIEQPLRSGDPLTWLQQHPVLMRVFWSGAAFDLELAGVGVCYEHEGPPLTALDELLDIAGSEDAADSLRLIGALRFDLGRAPDREWASFGRARFHLPMLEMRRTSGAPTLAVNLKAGRAALQSGAYDAQRRIALRCLRGTAPAARPPPPGTAAPEGEDRAAWSARVEEILKHIAGGDLQKAVLARRTLHVALADADPVSLLMRLRAAETPACHFLVQPSPSAAFLGASPEHLYVRDGRTVASEALAGTRPRGATPERDRLLAGNLLQSEKDRREHGHVHRHLLQQLGTLCQEVESPEHPTVLSLPTLHHLRTPVLGTLQEGVRDAALLAALHPTPAVCGTPTETALECLRGCEPFDRGLYAGPVGCFGRQRSEVAVGIRSALLIGDTVRVFAGAGIVAGSDPDAEWQETVEKMRAIQRLLGADRAP